MKKVQFLTAKALNGDRPDWAKQISGIVFWATSAAGIITMTISSIPPDVKGQINEWIVALNAIVKLGSHGFGEVQK